MEQNFLKHHKNVMNHTFKTTKTFSFSTVAVLTSYTTASMLGWGYTYKGSRANRRRQKQGVQSYP